MSKTLVIKDRCLAPESSVKVKYSGLNPFKICKSLPDMFKDFLEVGGSDIKEEHFEWDTSTDPISFKIKWRIKKGIDTRSDFILKVKAKGEQSKREGRGEVTISIGGSIVTEYEYRFFIQETLIRIYQQLFYNKQRSEYISRGRRAILKLRDELKRMVKVVPRL